MATRIDPIVPRLKWDVLDPSELERIHEATLFIMEEVGVRFPSARALDISLSTAAMWTAPLRS